MTVTKNERLSALVDDEADDFECRRLLDELGRNPDDLTRWERYHLIGDAVRGGLRRSANAGFAAGVMARIAHEPVPAPVIRTMGQRLVKPTAGLAMAASVAVAVLVGVVNVTGTPDADTPAVAEAGPAAAPAVARGVQVSDATVATATPLAPPALEPMDASDARLHSYIVNHAEHAAGRGLMPYVRVVGYETPAQ
jgi:sigma-E factor negative regulatory protein RseA